MFINIGFKASFIRRLNALNEPLREEAVKKIELLKNTDNHASLKVHKLHGRLAGYFSFSVNYKFRVVFEYVSKNGIALLSVGDHKIYD